MNGVTRMESVSDAERNDILSSIGRFCSKHRTLLIILVIAVVMRLVLSLFVTSRDMIGFVEVIQNLEANKGLYQIEGYWYTPVIGYLLSFMDMVADAFGWFPVHSVVVPEFLPTGMFNIPDPAFNLFIKIPMVIGDILVAVILYSLVKEYVDQRTALIATALWLFAPIVWFMSSCQGQFDALCIGLFLISFLLLRKDRFLFAGVFLALSVWLKIFPVLCGLFFVYYIYRKFDDRAEMKRNMFLFFAGLTVTTLLVFLPQIVNGELPEAFLFITSRLAPLGFDSGFDTMAAFRMLVMIAVVAVVMILISKRFLAYDCESLDRELLIYSAFMIACGASIYMGYQYIPCWIFCLIVLIAMIPRYSKVFYCAFGVLSILPFLEGLLRLGPMVFAIPSQYFGLFDPGVLASQYVSISTTVDWSIFVLGIWQLVALLTLAFVFIHILWPEKLEKAMRRVHIVQ